MWVIKWLAARGITPLAWHAGWKANGGLQDSDAAVLLHESHCRILETSLCYDQINAGSLAALELVCRQIQNCEDKLSHHFEVGYTWGGTSRLASPAWSSDQEPALYLPKTPCMESL